MAFPVDNTKFNSTGRYGPRKRIKLTNGKWSGTFHGGDDLAPEVKGALELTYAVGKAKVHSYGRKADAGIYIILQLQDNSLWRYAHLSSIANSVVEAKKNDTWIEDGAPIGRIGATGNVTGVHLHIERYADGQLNVRSDPRPYYWSEWNPARPKPAAAAPKPAPAKPAPSAPRPTPTQKKRAVVNGHVQLTKRWYAYTYNNLTDKQRTLLPVGTYRIVGIVNGNLRVRGNGRDAWIHSSAAAYVV